MTTVYSFTRYLMAKRSVDDRALNRSVWQALQNTAVPIQPMRILEIGGGMGSMFQRMVEWGLLECGHYTLLDSSQENIQTAGENLAQWAHQRGWQVERVGENLVFQHPKGKLVLELAPCDLFDFIQNETGRAPAWDLIIAHAFLDLVDIPRALSLLRGVSRVGGLFYLTINFDGLTAFEPVIDAVLDEKIIALYHQSMDERVIAGHPSGNSRSGRRMFTWLPQAGFDILAAGGSDWAVYPKDGTYPGDEAYFLKHILHFFADSLSNHPALTGEPFNEWLAERHAQIERGELVYLAHQFDFLAVQR